MGMSASQARILELTARKTDIGLELQTCAIEKDSLARDMTRVSRKYQDALNTKVYKWSTNSGVTYSDLTYSTLMTPNPLNNNKLYLLTDQSGRVVIDDQYKKYAQIISPNGEPGGNWISNRVSILSQLTGMPAEKIMAYEGFSTKLNEQASYVNTLETEMNRAYNKAFPGKSAKEFAGQFGNSWEGINSWGDKTNASTVADDYKNNTSWILTDDVSSSTTRLNQMIDSICTNACNSLEQEDAEKFKKACETVKKQYEGAFTTAQSNEGTEGLLISKMNSGNAKGKFVVSATGLIDCILNAYLQEGGSASERENGNIKYHFYTDKSKYEAYLQAKENYENAKKTFYDTDRDYNTTLTSGEEIKLRYYDELFSAVAENGWTYNDRVSDPSYLNEMLQNNQFYVSTVSSAKDKDNDGFIDYEFESSFASHSSNFFLVNDSALQNQAFAEYEYEKGVINAKEKKVDTKMQNLETEQSAIQKMIDSIKQQESDNIDRTYNIFG